MKITLSIDQSIDTATYCTLLEVKRKTTVPAHAPSGAPTKRAAYGVKVHVRCA